MKSTMKKIIFVSAYCFCLNCLHSKADDLTRGNSTPGVVYAQVLSHSKRSYEERRKKPIFENMYSIVKIDFSNNTCSYIGDGKNSLPAVGSYTLNNKATELYSVINLSTTDPDKPHMNERGLNITSVRRNNIL